MQHVCGRKGIVVLLFAFFLGSTSSLAQLPTATILGVVQDDATGAVMPQADLTALNVDTGLTRTTVSALDGSYRFAALPIGNYEVTATQVDSSLQCGAESV